MRRSGASSGGYTEKEWPIFPIGPILVHYGFEPPQEDRDWHPVRCAFHGDRDASASVSTTRQAFNCHACGVKGFAVNLVMKEEGVSYSRAVEKCTEIAGESDAAIREAPGSRSSVSRRSGNRQGGSRYRRSWRSD